MNLAHTLLNERTYAACWGRPLKLSYVKHFKPGCLVAMMRLTFAEDQSCRIPTLKLEDCKYEQFIFLGVLDIIQNSIQW